VTATNRVRVVIVAGLLVLFAAIVRTAWVGDDAYITFRTADNIVHGYGPVWNIAERVQSFTHPLWLALFTVFYAVTGEPYYTAIGLGIALSIATVAVLIRSIAVTPWTVLIAVAALASSKAFVDYSTSGLENALSHLLIVLFAWRWWVEPAGETRMLRLSALAALCLLNRLDLALLVGPALMVEAWRTGRSAWRPLIIGMLPLVFWEAFSMFYYASPVPNTAYAKLNIATPATELAMRGLTYLRRTAEGDPATIPVILLAAAVGLRSDRRSSWPLVAGVALTVLYLLRIGGDFMMGRFLTAPFVLSVAILAHSPWPRDTRTGAIVAAALVLLGLVAPWEPAALSGYGYARLDNLLHGRWAAAPRDGGRSIGWYGVIDERRYYYESTGLLKSRPGHPRPDHPNAEDGRALRAGSARVVVRDSIGFVGYFAGPKVHIVDPFALSDPLLSRLPAIRGSRTGHYLRDIPAGYLESLESQTNQIANPDLAAFYDRLRVAVSGPLWSRSRLTSAAALMTGRYDHHLRAYLRPREP
jgi:arabinofuranosyltransferase